MATVSSLHRFLDESNFLLIVASHRIGGKTVITSIAFMKKTIAFLSSFGILACALAQPAKIPKHDHFNVETLVTGLVDAMEMAVLPTGDVLIAERTGSLKWFSATTKQVKELKKFAVSVKTGNNSRETGLLGVAADPNFLKTPWIYVCYSPPKPEEHRLSRFTLQKGELTDEKILLTVPQSRADGVCHEGGSIAFDKQGHLFLSFGDNTNPFAADGSAPINEIEGVEHQNAQRSAGNTNDLRGKIIRIKPTADGRYTIPKGNLFPPGTPKTRPEIFVMGNRNPWRIGVDQRTSFLYWGEVGPDARKESPRGPGGYDEINQAKTAGYYGWPYFIADNKAYTAYDFKEKKLGKPFNVSAPTNESRLNTGLKQLPPPRPALWFVQHSCHCAATVYYYDDYPASATKLPKELDQCLITYDWNNGHMQLTKLNKNSDMEWKENWLFEKKFIHPSDVEMGKDGSMYVLEYGSSWYDSKDGKLKKITYSTTPISVEKQKVIDPRLAGLKENHPGTLLLAESNCISCHQTKVKSVGPSYVEVADRYRKTKDADTALIKKVMQGGGGVWGAVPMPPNPQYNEEQVNQMIDAILALEPIEHKE